MSYEGHKEWLCAKGHYFCTDVYEDDPVACWICGAVLAWSHSVDDTNGPEDGCPSTMAAPKRVIGKEEFVATRELYAPEGEWIRVA